MLSSKTLQPLDSLARLALAKRLGETPRTAMSHNVLLNGNGLAFGLGDAYLIEPRFLPGEPAGFAPDAAALWALLRQVEGWFCVLVDAALARVLGPLVETELGQPVRYYADVLFTLAKPTLYQNAAVRLLAEDDLPVLLSAPAVSSLDTAQHRALLAAGMQVGAIVDGQLVALANVDSATGRYAEIGVVTLAKYRQRGYASAAASLLVQQLLAQGRIPLWSCGESNAASIATAQKIGFVECDRRLYVIPTRPSVD